MVDDIVRSETDKLEAASDAARLKLRTLDLPDCLQVRVCVRVCACACVRVCVRV